MIKQICFIDDYMYPLPKVEYDYDYCVVKPENGFFQTLKDIELIADNKTEYCIVFNNPFLLDFLKEYVTLDNILIYDYDKSNFAPIQETTNKDLTDYKKKNLCKLFVGRHFNKNCYCNVY